MIGKLWYIIRGLKAIDTSNNWREKKLNFLIYDVLRKLKRAMINWLLIKMLSYVKCEYA